MLYRVLLAASLLSGCSQILGLDEYGEPVASGAGGIQAGAGGAQGGAGADAGGAGGAPSGTTTGMGGAVCGNGVIEADEECDDRNHDDGDACEECVVPCAGTNTAKSADGHCFLFVDGNPELGQWGKADNDCTTRFGGYGRVATIRSDAQRFAAGSLTGEDVWLGGQRVDEMSPWTWVTGESWDYEVWQGGMPGPGGCLVLSGAADQFKAADCLFYKAWLCELTPVGTPAGG